MKGSNRYKLHIKIHLKRASLVQTGKAIGVLCRKHLIPQQILCTTERTNNTEVSKKAEMVITKLLGRPSPWGLSVDRALPKTQLLSLDDEKVYRLAERWDGRGMTEYMVIIPHIFYMPLFQCSMQNIELQAPEILRKVCIFFDYAILEKISDIVRPCFFGERAQVLKYVQKMGLFFIDSGHQLFLENLISLACYMIPAKYLVFKDDDFFINNTISIDKLLDPLKRGYLMSGCLISGRYTKSMDRVNTGFFALRPDCLRNELLLFDNGENHYADAVTHTGAITYRVLSNLDPGVFILSDYQDGDVSLGRHLHHCASELWFDLPQILRKHFRHEIFPKKVGKMKLDVSILLEALALLFKVHHHALKYDPVDNELRRKAAAGSHFTAYFSKIYNNYHWLVNHANSPSRNTF